MEAAAALLTFFVVLASAGEADKPAPPKNDEQHNAKYNTAHVDDRFPALCDSRRVIYRDLTVQRTQAEDTPQSEASEATE